MVVGIDWPWQTGAITEGPAVSDVTQLIDAYGAQPGWIGLTSSLPNGMQQASVLRFLASTDRPVPVIGWPAEPKFYIPEEALEHFRKAIERGKKAEADWQRRLAEYRKAHPELAVEWDRYVNGELPAGWEKKLPTFKPSDAAMATRQASGKVLNAISASLPTLVGGSADLAPSTDTLVKGAGDLTQGTTALVAIESYVSSAHVLPGQTALPGSGDSHHQDYCGIV